MFSKFSDTDVACFLLRHSASLLYIQCLFFLQRPFVFCLCQHRKKNNQAEGFQSSRRQLVMKLWTPYIFTLHYQHPSLCLRKVAELQDIINQRKQKLKNTVQTKRLLFRDKKKIVCNLVSISISARIKKDSHILQNKSVQNSHNWFPHCQQLFSLFPPYRSCARVAHTLKDKYQNCCSALVAHAPLTQAIWAISQYFSHQPSDLLQMAQENSWWWPLLAQKNLSTAN